MSIGAGQVADALRSGNGVPRSNRVFMRCARVTTPWCYEPGPASARARSWGTALRWG
jgi:hypothetical protein